MRNLIEIYYYKYLTFKKYKSNNKKTFDIEFFSSSGMLLGNIYWKSGWRRYIFEPQSETIFDSSCLKEITNCIDKLMEERKDND